MNYEDTVAARSDSLLAAEERLKSQSIKNLTLQLPDHHGRLNTRLAPLKLNPAGHMANSSVYLVMPNCGAPLGMPVYESPHIWFHTGFKNIRAVPDPDSLVIPDWQPETASIMLDTFEDDGTPYFMDSRAVLRNTEEKLRSQGMNARLGIELEFALYHADPEKLQQRDFSNLALFGEGNRYHDGCRDHRWHQLATTLMQRMEQIGAPLFSISSESGEGIYEIALAPLPPLQAADALARLRYYLKALCQEYDLIPTFMPRSTRPGTLQACGLHIHQSLCSTEDGHNLFAAAEGTDSPLSDTGRHYLGGLMSSMKAMNLIFRPTMNAYRRLERVAGMPEDICWGLEHRCVAVRVIKGNSPEQTRFEHRCCGPDINPYLTIAAMLEGGLFGIANHIDPEEPVTGNPAESKNIMPLPRSLEAAVTAFRESEFAELFFGQKLADHYARTRENEVRAFQEWLDKNITGFEYQRYFDAF
ncbi:glutamine synthetase family protein [Spongorhabdus nitratireducens]